MPNKKDCLKQESVVYDIAQCNDGKYRCFAMQIKQLGSVMYADKPYDMCLVGNGCKVYRNFSDIDNCLFVSKEEALSKVQAMLYAKLDVEIEIVDDIW